MSGCGFSWRAGSMCAAALGVCLATTACTSKHYREDADRQVYQILKAKQTKALGEAKPFTVEQTPKDPLAGLPVRSQPLIKEPATQGAQAMISEAEKPLALISLDKAVEIAILNNRDYQSQKESMYLSALDLTLERHQWTPLFSGLLSGSYNRPDRVDSTDSTWKGNATFGMSQLFATGAQASLKLSSDFLHHIRGDPLQTLVSSLSATITQPLWRGAGPTVAEENLAQAERDVIYAVRSFTRFHRTFLVNVASDYYELLRQRDQVRNEWNNHQNLVESRDRAENLANAGRLPEFQVDEARQDEFSALDRFNVALQRYGQLLDDFKISLGLKTDANVDVDEAELEKLQAAGPIHPDLSVDQAVTQALALRLDLMTAKDSFEDAKRKVVVAENGLGPDIKLVATANAGTPAGTQEPVNFRFNQAAYTEGLDVELPFDRLSERNTYRSALIQVNKSQRSLTLLEDNIRQQVRQDWRNLQQAKASYDIQQKSRALAQRRVENTALLLQANQATTRNLLDAQTSLRDSQNAVTQALVDHTVARLQLWRDIETLDVTSDYKLEGTTHGQ